MAADSESVGEGSVECCPECLDTQFWERSRKTPPYRCQNGHTFDTPDERPPNTKPPNRIAGEVLLNDLRRVADDLGHPPRATTYNELGNHQYATLSSHFESWTRALTAAGLNPDEVPSDRGPNEGTRKLQCYHCGHEFMSAGESRTVYCPGCATNVNRHRALLTARGNTHSIAALADGPLPASEFPENGRTWASRDVVARLKAIRPGMGRKSRPPSESVYYLYGDDRAAIRTFISVNREYVASCLDDTNNPLVANWPDELYQLLVEQWAWMDDHGGDSE